MSLLGLFVRDLGVDLGTVSTRLFVPGQGVVLTERSVVTLDSVSSAPLTAGDRAGLAVGRTPKSMRTVSPLRDGVVDDFSSAQILLHAFIQKVQPRRSPFRPRMVIAVPAGATGVERRAVAEAAVHAGAREAYTIAEPLAAALGAGMKIDQPFGQMVVCLGGGSSEAAILAAGGVVVVRSERTGGRHLDDQVTQLLRRRQRLLIGETVAEDLKIRAGLTGPDQTVEVVGVDMVTGRPAARQVELGEIRAALAPSVRALVEMIRQTLEGATPELAADVSRNGMMLTGGGALLEGFDAVIARETGLSVAIAEEPMLAVVRGTGVALETGRALKGQAVKGSGTAASRRRTVTA